MSLSLVVHSLLLPLAKLVASVSLGLLVANLIESLNWTHKVAGVATPLVRLGNLSETTGASFSMAFFSNTASNSLLAEGYEQQRIGRLELVLANLLNSLPTYFLHLPTMFFITIPLIKSAAFVYVGLTLAAAFLRTAFVLVVGRIMLPATPDICVTCQLGDKSLTLREAMLKAWKQYKLRIRKILFFTVPIYIGFFLVQRYSVFSWLETVMASHVGMLAWLDPRALSIIVFHIAAEFTAGLAAAGALLDAGSLPERQIILALLVGNILSSPVRIIRHQYPYYAGIFNPRLAFELVLYSQAFRMGSILLVTVLYALL